MKRLAELRKKNKITQDRLASVMGVSRATVGHWENGDYQPDINMLTRIAAYFGVTVDYLIGNCNEPLTYLTDSEQKLINTIRNNRLKINEIIEFAEFKAANKK